jgi:peptide/nickel transport system permease protein
MILRFALTRLWQAVPVLLLVSVLAFALTAVAGDPLAAVVGPDASPAQRAAAAERLGLAAPLPQRYARFMLGVARGDFGISTRLARPVGGLVAERLPATAELAGVAFALALFLAVPGGVMAALRRRGLPGRLLMGASLVAVSLPPFLTGTLLILLFSATLRWLPSFGRGEVVQLDGWSTGLLTLSGWRALVLPAFTLGLFQSALLLRLVRDGVVAALDSGFIRFAWARGLPRARVLRHALANALLPVVTAGALQLGALIAFSVVTESVFQWPGLGLLLVQSVAAADVPVISTYLLLVALTFLVLNCAADLLCLAIDPRLRPTRPAARTAA